MKMRLIHLRPLTDTELNWLSYQFQYVSDVGPFSDTLSPEVERLLWEGEIHPMVVHKMAATTGCTDLNQPWIGHEVCSSAHLTLQVIVYVFNQIYPNNALAFIREED